ncbi:hypothetical protein [Alteromonas sp. A079]|uniref:hypothetical protein n=1 Tax=Alteromonas sp. A079 TaxID=3410268 RepID=UPI003BA2624D
MTNQLVALLSTITQQATSQSGLSSNGSNPTSSATLSQASVPVNAVNIDVAMRPNNVLAIRYGETEIQVSLTPEVMATLKGKIGAQQNALLSLSNNSNATSTAALLSTQTHTTSIPIPANKRGDLLNILAQVVTQNSSASVSLRATLAQLSNGNVTLELPGGNQLNLPTTGSGEIENVLKTLEGKRVLISLTPLPNRTLAAQISAPSAPGSSPSTAMLINSASAKGMEAVQAIIETSLKQSGVAIVQDAKSLSLLAPFLTNAKPISSFAALQTAHAFTLSDKALTIKSASALPLLTVEVKNDVGLAIPPSSASKHHAQRLIQSASLPHVNHTQTRITNISRVLQDNGVSATSASTQKASTHSLQPSAHNTIQHNNVENTDGHALSAKLKGSEVHHAISQLSRVLLGQTGSTQQALTQLLSIVEGNETKGAAVKSPTELQGLGKVSEQLKGINPLTAPPSQKNAVSSPQPTSTSSTPEPKPNVEPTKHSDSTTDKPSTKSPLSQITALLSGQVKNATSNALHAVFSKSTAPTPGNVPLTNITNVATETAGTAATGEVDNTAVGKAVKATAEGTMAQNIQNLLLTPALLTTPSSLTAPIATSNFVQGLVALLQLSLAGRALQRQPGLKPFVDAPDSIITKTLSAAGSTATPSRVAQDVASLDSRLNVIANLKTLLSNHQQAKVGSVDSRLQGQDTFYYILPSVSLNTAPPELLVQREPKHKEHADTKKQGQALWNVTMKLDIGEAGTVLAKSKIDVDTITLDLYTSNSTLLVRVADTLPYLEKRLTELGLNIATTSFQTGVIPTSLNTRPHQIFETRV